VLAAGSEAATGVSRPGVPRKDYPRIQQRPPSPGMAAIREIWCCIAKAANYSTEGSVIRSPRPASSCAVWIGTPRVLDPANCFELGHAAIHWRGNGAGPSKKQPMTAGIPLNGFFWMVCAGFRGSYLTALQQRRTDNLMLGLKDGSFEH